MQVEKPKIELYKVRNFGEKFSATFDFIRENFRLWLRAYTYLILPLCLFQAYAMQNLMGAITPLYLYGRGLGDDLFSSAEAVVRLGVSYLGYVICAVIGSVLLFGICYGMMKYYHRSPDRLRGVSLAQLKPLIVQAGKRSLAMFALMFVLLIAASVFISISAVVFKSNILLFALVIALLVCMLPLSLAIPVYVFEDKMSLFGSVSRGLSLGFKSFWPLLGLMLVMGILANILSTITTIPWYGLAMIRAVFTLSGEGQGAMTMSPFYSFGLYLSSVLMNFGAYLTTSLSVFAVAYHYGSVAERENGLSVEDGIQNFEQLAEKDTDIDNFDNL